MRTLDRTSKIVRGGLGVLVATSLAAGCGDDGDGGGDVTTGLPPTKLLSDVTEAEAQSACTRLQTGFNRVFDRSKLIRSICTLSGAVVADTTAECVTFRDDCIEQGNMSGSAAMQEIEQLQFDCDGDLQLAECTGTVGQFETCVNDTFDRLETFLNQFTCEDAANVEQEDLETFGDMVGEPPASCEAVGCPGDSPFAPDDSGL